MVHNPNLLDETLYEYTKLSRLGSLKLWFIWKKVKVDLDFLDEQAIELLNEILVQLPNNIGERSNYYNVVLASVLKKHVPIIPVFQDIPNNLGHQKVIQVLNRKKNIIEQLENLIREKLSADFLDEGKAPISKTKIDDSEEFRRVQEIEDLVFIAQTMYQFLDRQIAKPQFNSRQKVILGNDAKLIISLFHELGYVSLLSKSNERYVVISNIAKDCASNVFTDMKEETVRRYFNDLMSEAKRKEATSNYLKVQEVLDFIQSNKGL